MKRLTTLLMLMLATTVGNQQAFSQAVTITLNPGWTWISYSRADTLDFATALGTFTPMEGDIIKSQYGFAMYQEGQWSGGIQQFYPGLGYMYYSMRTVPTPISFGEPAPQVIVTTMEPTNITTNSATCGGNVASSDGNYVFVILRGICWSTNPNPTFNDNYVEVGNGLGTFIASMTDLTIGATYYVRAFAVTANGTFYGDEKSFSAKNGFPTLITSVITNISEFNAIGGGDITDDGGFAVTTRGVCWSTTQNPTITDSHTVDSSGTGGFISRISGLNPSTTYYVRAYATNEYATAYGDEMSFVTLDIPIGAINGLFSVSETQQVWFSQGNLQYQASTNIWRFAENQWDFVGDEIQGTVYENNVKSDNSLISPTYDGWIDLFGWGTSGYNHGAICYQPWSTSTNSHDYYAYGNYQYNLYDQTGQADWGYNYISNGGDTVNQWRTLTQSELSYIMFSRSTASGIRYAKANVNGINGLILLPDDWDASTFSLLGINNNGANYNNNILTISQWGFLEQSGAIFLPASGVRESGMSVNYSGLFGYYWLATYSTDWYNNSTARCLNFTGSEINSAYPEGRQWGICVRLVQDYNP